MHPALHSWREELPRAFVRLLAYVGGAAALSMAAAQLVQYRGAVTPAPPAVKPQWVDIERVFPAFALSLPEAADMPTHYAVRRNVVGNGRMDILSLGEVDGADPYLVVRIYRPGTEMYRSAADRHRRRRGRSGPGKRQGTLRNAGQQVWPAQHGHL